MIKYIILLLFIKNILCGNLFPLNIKFIYQNYTDKINNVMIKMRNHLLDENKFNFDQNLSNDEYDINIYFEPDNNVSPKDINFCIFPNKYKDCDHTYIMTHSPPIIFYSVINYWSIQGYKKYYVVYNNNNEYFNNVISYIIELHNVELLNDGEFDVNQNIEDDSIIIVLDDNNNIIFDIINKDLPSNTKLILPPFINEYNTHEMINGKSKFKGTYIISGYFQSLNTPENQELINEIGLESGEYLTDSVYISTMFLKFFDDIPLTIPDYSINLLLNSVRNCVSSLISNNDICSYHISSLYREMYLGKVEENGDIKEIIELHVNYPSVAFDNFKNIVESYCGVDINNNINPICIISNSNPSNPGFIQIVNGVYSSINNINKVYLLIILEFNK